MTPKEISDMIYSFDGSPKEWLELEKKVRMEIENFSEEENEELIETECMEQLTTICEGIRLMKE